MRRLRRSRVIPDGGAPPAVLIYERDYRLMRAVVKAADEQARHGNHWPTVLRALDAFNAGGKRK